MLGVSLCELKIVVFHYYPWITRTDHPRDLMDIVDIRMIDGQDALHYFILVVFLLGGLLEGFRASEILQ